MKKVLVCLAVAVAMFSYGCSSSRPELTAEEEGPYNECEALVTQAEADFDVAKQAGAESFAKDAFSTASLSLENSKKFLELKDFPKAKESAMRASEEAKRALAIPKQAETGITETEKEINEAKEAKVDEESPVSYKEAVDQIEAAKLAYNEADFALANLGVLKAAAAIKKAKEEPAAAKKAVEAVEADMNMAKELKIDTVSPDSFKIATESYELAKSNLASKNNGIALESATKASETLKDEMKKSVNLFVEQAKTDINTAKEAGASEFAAEQLAVAEESLSNANAALEKGEFINAKSSAEKVSSTSKEAEAKAKAGKEAKAAAAPAADAATPAADAAKPSDSAAASEVSKPKIGKVKGEIPLAPAATTKTAKTSSNFPKILVIVVVVLAIVAVFVIRMVRKKATTAAADSQTA